MLAFPEILKSILPVKKAFSKGSSFRKHFLEKGIDLLAIIISIYLALSIEGWAEKRKEETPKNAESLQMDRIFSIEIIPNTISAICFLKYASTGVLLFP